MRSSFFVFLIIFFIQSNTCFPQSNSDEFAVLFYNVENLFDTNDEAGKEDDEFTPNGDRHWTDRKLTQKLVNISKVILGSSGFDVPKIIALCEIENRYILERLLNTTPLKNFNYKIIHKESPDHRGIDVALLYNAETIYPLEYDFYPLKNENNEIINTREILYFSGIVNQTDTLHFFINHWPSRYDGLLESEPMRKFAARLLKERIDKLQNKVSNPKIVILGDFNDQPVNESISGILEAKAISSGMVEKDRLYNLSITWMKKKIGTLKYQAQWSVFDQCIVSGSLIKDTNGYHVVPGNAEIVSLPFLFEKDERYGGVRPFRTYYGYSYKGGFSDHLPVLLKLTSN